MNKKKKEETNEAVGKFFKDPYGNVWGPSLIKSPAGRLVYPALVTPKKYTGNNNNSTDKNDPKYEATILFGKDNPKVTSWLVEHSPTIEAMLAYYNKGQSAKLSINQILKDGDDLDTDKYPFYENKFFMVARNPNRPLLVSTERDSKDNLIEVEPAKFFGGLMVKAVVKPLLTAKGVSYRLDTLIWGKDDGTRIGGSFETGKDMVSQSDSEDFLDDNVSDETDDSLDKAASNVL